MYGYIYLTTNLINNKKYVGKRTKDFYSDNKYLGSGTIIKKAINKYGFENFSKTLIEECSSLEELNNREEYWIEYYNAVENPMFYNLTPKANGSAKGSKRSEDTKRKLSSIFSGRLISDEQKSKISKTVSSQIWVTNDIIETKATEDNIDDFIKNGFRRGRLKFSKEHCYNCGNWHRGRKMSDEFKQKMSKVVSGKDNPFYGKSHSEASKAKMRKSQSGRKYINNGIICKRVKLSELQSYIDNGWVKGMLRKVRSSETIESIANEKYISE